MTGNNLDTNVQACLGSSDIHSGWRKSLRRNTCMHTPVNLSQKLTEFVCTKRK